MGGVLVGVMYMCDVLCCTVVGVLWRMSMSEVCVFEVQ